MFTIIKYSIAIALGIYIYNNFVDTKKVENKPKVVKTIPKHQCPIDKGSCKVCGINGHSKPVKKEVVFFSEEGQILTENQVSIKTPEGKEEFRKQMGWLIDICDDYALKEYQKKHGINVGE